jgi:3-dehydroquinate synthase
VIRDAEYFAFLEERLEEIFALDGAAMARVVEGSCRIKADVVAADEREAGLRAILNFGHTIGHAVEALARYGKVRHGEAVGMGMIAATRLGEAMGVTDPALLPRLTRLLERSGLPTRLPALAAEDCLEKIKTDKKTRDGRARFVLPVRLGETTIRDDAPRDAIRRALVETGATE